MRSRHSNFKEVNVRPEDYKCHRDGGSDNGGDCTTRCMTYCLNGAMSYREVEDEQYRLAKIRGTRRNTTGTYDLIMKNFGYEWIQLNTLKSRGYVAKYLKVIESPMMTLSRTHICPIHKGEVIDTWNSTGGMVFGIMVKVEDIDHAIEILVSHGIECEKVAVPKHKVNHHRRRHYRYW